LKVLDEKNINFEKWEEFVFNHPDGNFFQSVKAYRFFKSVDNHKPFVFAVEETDVMLGVLSGVIVSNGVGIKKYFSRRLIIWGGPLILNKLQLKERKEIVNLLLNKLDKYCSKEAIYIEFRNIFDMTDYKEVFTNNNYKYVEHMNFKVELKSYDENIEGLKKDKRYELKKSLGNGAVIKIAEKIEEIEMFYFILRELYEKKIKKPLNNLNFFINFFNYNVGIVLLIMYRNEIVGGVVCPIYKDNIYEWYEVGKLKINDKIYPNIVATWAPIDYGIKNGLKNYDMMGAGKPDEDYGVREFKSKFGGKLVEYGRFERINNNMLMKIGKLGLKFIKFSRV